MSTRTTSAGILVALVSAATFATSGPFAKSLLATGWTPGSVVFLRIAVARTDAAGADRTCPRRALAPAAAASGARWSPSACWPWRCRSWPSSTPCGHLSVGVALMLEYLGMVLVVVWQAVLGRRLRGR